MRSVRPTRNKLYLKEKGSNMTKAQQNYLDFLAAIERVLKKAGNDLPILLGEAGRVLPEIAGLQSAIRQCELLVPVVGAFSAGKSSLLNALVGAELLPVAITPETAMPTELRYDNRERLEVVFLDGQTQEFPLGALPSLPSRAQEIELVRLYAERPALKALQPLVLVDMPGFNSPLDVHNRAIAHYIGQGAHYLFVVSVEEGALHTQSMRRIEEVVTIGRTFSVCVNKADLRPQQEVEAIRTYIGEQLSEVGLEPAVCIVSQQDVSSVQAMLSTIHPDKLVSNLFRAPLQQFYQTLEAVLQTAMDALKRDHAENERTVSELEDALRELETQRNAQLSAARSADLASAVDDVLLGVSNALHLAVDDMARAALRSQDELGRVVSDEIRASLILELKQATDHLSAEVVSQFTQAYASGLRSEIQITEGWAGTVLKGLQEDLLPLLLSSLGSSSGKTLGMAARWLGGAAVVGKMLPHPILKIAALILPSLLEHLLGQVGEGQRLEQAKKAIREELIPDVLRGLRPEVATFLANANDQAVAAVADAFEQQLQAQQNVLQQAKKHMQAANKDGMHAAVLALRTEVQALARAHQVL
ncbi:conserved hypothetical protein [Acidovorax delafieldii 2AN]|jgi:ribosome biogenesis GTPase A|uniref:Dynamin N-terminal domain-containing protein n=2 Tax=Acidovorax delafieldii TaxID=47920 RepID=C5SZH0_ACIDE|nr:conserved hypothetical protein [Acidovorax delafieldii 2AN]